MTESNSERIAKLESRLDHQEEDLTEIKVDVREIRDVLLEGKGGWKVAGTLLALAGGVVIAVISAWATRKFGFNAPQ